MFNYKLAKFLRLSFFYLGCIAFVAFFWFLGLALFKDFDYSEERLINFYFAFGNLLGGLFLFLGALTTQYFSHQLGIHEPEPEEDIEYD